MKTYTFMNRSFCLQSIRFVFFAFIAPFCVALAFGGPVHDAARKGDVNKLKTLLQGDPKLVGDRDKLGDTPLHSAALHGQLAAAQVLIEAGADVNAKNNYGAFTPSDLGVILYSSNHQDPVSLLTVHGVDARDMKNGYTPLSLSLFASRHKELVQLLVEKGADVNALDQSQHRPLTYALQMDDHKWADYLKKHGAHE